MDSSVCSNTNWFSGFSLGGGRKGGGGKEEGGGEGRGKGVEGERGEGEMGRGGGEGEERLMVTILSSLVPRPRERGKALFHDGVCESLGMRIGSI